MQYIGLLLNVIEIFYFLEKLFGFIKIIRTFTSSNNNKNTKTMKSLFQSITGIPAIISLLAGINELLKGNTQTVMIAMGMGMFLTTIFLLVSKTDMHKA